MKARMLSAALVLSLILSMVSIPFSSRAEALTISYAAAAPNMVSLFGDLTSSGAVPDSPLGPGWSVLAVKVAAGPATSVRLDLKTFILSILPADMTPYLQPGSDWDVWLNQHQNVDMTYNAGADLWTYNFSLNSFFQFIPARLQAGKTLQVISEGMRLGSKTITAMAQPGSVTSTITIYVVDAQTPLNAGWNLISTPMALSSNTWTAIKALGSATADIDATIRWDNSNQEWTTVGGSDAIAPLEGIYVHSTAQRPLGAILSRTASAPPTRTIRAGWNLVGPAPDLSLNSGYYKATAAGGSYRGLTKVTELAATLVGGTTYYYDIVTTPGQERGFTATYSHQGTTVATHAWGYAQDPWTYIAPGTGQTIYTNSPVPTTYFGWLVPFGGTWVYDGQGTRTLAGFSSTPVSASWLRTARNIVLGW